MLINIWLGERGNLVLTIPKQMQRRFHYSRILYDCVSIIECSDGKSYRETQYSTKRTTAVEMSLRQNGVQPIAKWHPGFPSAFPIRNLGINPES
jgi:hypothetical protein